MSQAEVQLKDLRNLESLALHGNVLTASTLKLETRLDSLTTVDIANNTFPALEIDMRTFEALENLREMNLSGNFLRKLVELDAEKFAEVRLLVDGNSFECSWLNAIASTEVFQRLLHAESDFKSFNIDGLSCQYTENLTSNETLCSSYFIDPVNNEARWELLELERQRNFILGPEVLIIIVCASCLLGVAVTFISINIRHKRRLLNQAPFYHLLRDSFVRPISDVRSTWKRDFKEIISRNLPPTNYEHPISDSIVTEMSDVSAANIYEEIPVKDEQDVA